MKFQIIYSILKARYNQSKNEFEISNQKQVYAEISKKHFALTI
jgi:uncharacterized protein YxjI